MRTIKFRGLRVDGQGWVYGWVTPLYNDGYKGTCNRVCIKSGIVEVVEVIPESVGQFTGKLTIAGVEIYEGDLIFKPFNCITEEVIWNQIHLSWYFGFKRLCHLHFLDKITGNIHEK
jgi:hypothetical protein